jgi:hypothetical protein
LAFGVILEQGNSTMSTTHQDKPGGKPRQRSRKAEQRSRKPDRPRLDQREADEQIHAARASIDPTTIDTAAPEDEAAAAEASSISAVAPADAPSIGAVALAEASSTGAAEPANPASNGAVAPADNLQISIQTIANAYSDYTRKSLEETTSFVDKLTGVRSLDKAIEIQAEFAKQVYETFVAESQRICGLYGELARQIFKPWRGFVVKLTQDGR